MPYAYDALEPHIDARTMEIHHETSSNIHDKLNAALDMSMNSRQNYLNVADINSVPEDKRCN